MNCEEFVVDLLQNYINANNDMKQDNDRLRKENRLLKELIGRLLHNIDAYTYPDGTWQLNVSYDPKTSEKLNKLFEDLKMQNPFTSLNF